MLSFQSILFVQAAGGDSGSEGSEDLPNSSALTQHLPGPRSPHREFSATFQIGSQATSWPGSGEGLGQVTRAQACSLLQASVQAVCAFRAVPDPLRGGMGKKPPATYPQWHSDHLSEHPGWKSLALG